MRWSCVRKTAKTLGLSSPPAAGDIDGRCFDAGDIDASVGSLANFDPARFAIVCHPQYESEVVLQFVRVRLLTS